MANKNYPLALDPRIYEALKQIAKAKGTTIKQILVNAIGLYIADNIILLIPPEEKNTSHNV
ncbi:MAG: hypothetical protein CMK59_05520 [Proteobacteria bacterium]|nr:hypothetical protein [Pseudomonadota bacterium]